MKRLAIAALAVSIAGVAHADTPAKPPPKPDDIADIESREANLERKEPREGFAFTFAPAGSLMIGGDVGVGRGPGISLRLGHVATRKTNITFELTQTYALHKAATNSETLADSLLFIGTGAQRYTSRSFWVRLAGGLAVLTKDGMWPEFTGGDKPLFGAGALAGAGLDIASTGTRWGNVVFGFEGFGIGSVSRDGAKLQLSFGAGLSWY